MVKAIKRGREDYMGFTWFEILDNKKSTGQQFSALNKDHAIEMFNQSNKK